MGKIKILIVEDEENVAYTIKESLENFGYQIASIVDKGEDAVKAVKEEKIDLILMDIVLKSEMSGTEAAKLIWAQFNIPIIFLTGYLNNELIESAKISEPFGYILKPFNERELFAMIEIALYKFQMERKTHKLNSLLKIAKDISHTINKEDDPNILLKKVCKYFINSEDISSAWLVLIDNLNNVTTIIEEGLGKKYRQLESDLSRIEFPKWVRKVLSEKKILELSYSNAIKDGASFLDASEKLISIRIDSREKIYGLLNLVFTNRKIEDEEISLLESISKDLAFALSTFETQQKVKITEEALVESEKRYIQFIKTTQNAIIIHQSGKIIFANDASLELFKTFDENDLLNKNIFDFFLFTDEPNSSKPKDEMGLKNFLQELKLIQLDGSIIDISISSSPIVFRNLNSDQLVIKDISDRIKSEEEIKRYSRELEESNASKDKFFSIISHDLRSPFQGLLGLANIVTEEFDDLSNEELKEFLGNINRSSKNLFNLIENLLQWSRLQRKKIDIELTQNNLYSDIYYNINLLKPNADAKNISIVVDIDKEIDIYSDSNAFNSIVQNLISNAIKFTMPGGKIEISVLGKDNYIEIIISDTGVGIPDEAIPILFRIDNQHSTQGTEKETGTGLGLVICKELVEMQGGEISVKSKKDVGSTFSFTLKRAKST